MYSMRMPLGGRRTPEGSGLEHPACPAFRGGRALAGDAGRVGDLPDLGGRGSPSTHRRRRLPGYSPGISVQRVKKRWSLRAHAGAHARLDEHVGATVAVGVADLTKGCAFIVGHPIETAVRVEFEV